MEIESPSFSRFTRKQNSEQLPQDAYFVPKSQYLISSTQPKQPPPSYDFVFKQIKSGLIEKKTLNTNWQRRFFVLTPIRLLYFADQQRKELKGCFNLSSLTQHHLAVEALFPEILLTVSVTVEEQKQTKTLLVLQIHNQGIYNEWFKSLKIAIADIRLNMYSLGSFPRLQVATILDSKQKIGKSNINFWNKLTISPSQLLQYASHLDILFLRSNSTISYLHRFFMRSYYDHVGILIKDQSEKPYLLQVVNQKGVIVSSLQNLFNSAHEEYQEIGYRKLIYNSKLLPLQKLEDYINSILGKKYELSLTKLLINNQSEGQDETKEPQANLPEKAQRTYFCSELVADIYLKMGILMEGKSNSYWPKDFEEEVLNLSEGFKLSSLMKIELSSEEQDISSLDE